MPIFGQKTGFRALRRVIAKFTQTRQSELNSELMVETACFCICKRYTFVFVKVCKLLTKTHALEQSTESPILDAPFWSENGVSCPCERNKIGDSVLCIGDNTAVRCVAIGWLIDDAFVFVKVCKLLTKTHA